MSTTTETSLPECITRDNLTSPYWPATSAGFLYALASLAAIFIATSVHRLNHTDLWGHVNYGRWMAEHGALPATDPFAAAPSSIQALHSAWLAQRMFYETQRLLGNEGLVLLHALLVTLTAAAVIGAARMRGTPAVLAWLAGAAMFLLDLPIVGTIRPQLFGQLGAALVLLGCVQMNKRWQPLVWLPMVAMLWANLHGSILMGLAIVGIYAASQSWHAWREANGNFRMAIRNSAAGRAWLALMVMTISACLNPHGPQLLARIALFGDHAALAAISEWRPLTLLSLTGVLMIGSIALTIWLVKRSPRRWDAFDVALLVLFGLATLPAIRMLAWWAVVWPVVCLPHVAAVWRKHIESSSEDPTADADQPTAMRTLIAMGIVFMMVLVAPPTFGLLTGRVRGDGAILSTDTPLYLADEITRRGLAGSIAAPMDFGDYLVWTSQGQMRPLVHSHVHLADAETWQDYGTVFRGDEAWLSVLHKRQIDYVAVPRQRYPQLAKRVLLDSRSKKPRVRIAYQDQRTLLAEVLGDR